MDVVRMRRFGPDKKLTEAQELEVCQAYRQGLLVREICEQFAISRQLLYRTIAQHGVPLGAKKRGAA